jgi:hypothetical protein
VRRRRLTPQEILAKEFVTRLLANDATSRAAAALGASVEPNNAKISAIRAADAMVKRRDPALHRKIAALESFQYDLVGAPPFRIIGVPNSGQSLGTGDYGDPPLSTVQPYANVQLHDSSGNYNNAASGTWSRIPLIAPERADKYTGGGGITTPYPSNIGGESPDIACCNTISALLGANWIMLPSNCGQGGAAYTVIEKGGTGNAYASQLLEATVATGMAVGYGVGFALLTHGEADATDSPGVYSGFLESYQPDLQSDLQSITGQHTGIPLLLSQQNAFPMGPIGTYGYNQSSLEQIEAAGTSSIIFTGPKYYYPYYTDRAHLTNSGYQQLGEKYGQVASRILTGQGWTQFLVKSIQRVGNVITVTFNVPVTPLVFNTIFTPPHQSGTYVAWAAGKGFEAWVGGYNGTIVGISSVAIVGKSTVVITCSARPDTIGYAHTPDVGGGSYTGGFPDGRCGLLQDSDPFVGPITGIAQANWCPEFLVTGL